MESKSTSKRLLPVTFEIIEKLTKNEHFVVHKQKFDMITLVGRVEMVNEQNTKLNYMINDGTTATGMEVSYWKSSDDDEKGSTPVVKENDYVRIYGAIRGNNNVLAINAFSVQPVKDMNEITMHMIEVVYSNLVLRRIKNNCLTTSTISDTSYVHNDKPAFNGNNVVKTGISNDIPNLKDAILAVLKQAGREEGISVDEITNSLGAVDKKKIPEALNFLTNEGHIFTTIDDHHYKSAYD